MAKAVSEKALGRTGTIEGVYCDDYWLSPHRSRAASPATPTAALYNTTAPHPQA